MDMAETRHRGLLADDLTIGNCFTVYRYPTFEPECRTSVNETVQDDDIVIFIICLYLHKYFMGNYFHCKTISIKSVCQSSRGVSKKIQ